MPVERVLLSLSTSDNQVVALAADLVEAATAGGISSTDAVAEVGLVASAAHCVEIAIVMLGRAEPRTLEGGDRNLSRLVLFPYRDPDELSPAERRRGSTEDDSVGDALLAMIDHGAAEAGQRGDPAAMISATADGAFGLALKHARWDMLFALGSGDRSAGAIAKWRDSQRHRPVVQTRDIPARELESLVSRLSRDPEDGFTAQRRGSVQRAIQLAHLLDSLNDDLSSGPARVALRS